MFLLDSNIIIYAALNDNLLIEFVRTNSPYVSDISRVEVLGFQNITEKETQFFDKFFESTFLLGVSEGVIREAIRLRKKRRIALADALIAATAIVNDLTLVTRNTKDFKWMDSLTLINPLNDE